MSFFSKLFGKKKNNNQPNVRKRKDQPDVVDIRSKDEKMNWAMEKARLTLHYFKKCLESPKSGQSYFSVKVKIEELGVIEHIWLSDPSFDRDGNLFGIVGNKPIDVKNIELDQKIGIDKNLVSDWMIIENGRLIGGYTIRAIRDDLTGRALVNFDRGLGGMIVDEGEDYFLPDDSTPEGAIIKLETAYDNDNIQEAINCKDFFLEAEIMIRKKTQVDTPPKKLIDSTAELLKLSYLKSLQDKGIPKFHGLIRAFPYRQKISENQMLITSVCIYPNGEKYIQKMNVVKKDNSWKVLAPES